MLLLKLCFATDVPACIVTIDAAKGANAIAFSLPRLSFVVFCCCSSSCCRDALFWFFLWMLSVFSPGFGVFLFVFLFILFHSTHDCFIFLA